MLLYILRALTGLKVEKIGLFDDWMMTKKVTTLKKVVNLLDDLKVKYQESEKKQNAIYFLKYKVERVIEIE